MKQLALCRKNIYEIIQKIIDRKLSETEHKELKKSLTGYVEMALNVKWPTGESKIKTRERVMKAHLEDGEGEENLI